MFNNIKEFFNMLDVKPIWPVLITVLSFISCCIPYKPIAKIKETKDENGCSLYKIWEYRGK